MLLLALGCGGETGETVLYLTDADNHALSVEADVPVIAVEPQSDWQIHWDGVSTDLRCSPAEAAVTRLVMMKLDATAEEVQDGIEHGRLSQLSIQWQVWLDVTGAQSPGSVLDMGFFSALLDTPDELTADGTYLLLYEEASRIEGYDNQFLPVRTLSLALLVPESGAGVTDITLDDGCGMVTLTADFAAPVSLSGMDRIDWSGLTVDAFGNPLPDGVSNLSLDHFADLEQDTLALDYLPMEQVSDSWGAHYGNLSQTSIDPVETFVSDNASAGTSTLMFLDSSPFAPSTFSLLAPPLFLSVLEE